MSNRSLELKFGPNEQICAEVSTYFGPFGRLCASHVHDVSHVGFYAQWSGPPQRSVKLTGHTTEPYGSCKILNAADSSDVPDHLVQVPLEVALLHVNLLVGLDHVLQLLLSLLPLLELKGEREKGEGGEGGLKYFLSLREEKKTHRKLSL